MWQVQDLIVAFATVCMCTQSPYFDSRVGAIFYGFTRKIQKIATIRPDLFGNISRFDPTALVFGRNISDESRASGGAW